MSRKLARKLGKSAQQIERDKTDADRLRGLEGFAVGYIGRFPVPTGWEKKPIVPKPEPEPKPVSGQELWEFLKMLGFSSHPNKDAYQFNLHGVIELDREVLTGSTKEMLKNYVKEELRKVQRMFNLWFEEANFRVEREESLMFRTRDE